MKRRARRSRGQATLFAPTAEVDVIAKEATPAIIEALAELLLEATGQGSEGTEEVGDEPEDHG
ncbi:MAG: hypothetical protein JOZ69_02735 [Myxococcales bacterium]|nr:hypothetical protein [Myxococcales bacterium]